uniref:Abhydrolase domain-containing protein 14B n=1 Tax=Lepeophtheirus salmonis TaxID=72036 RepID=C1BT01_LEPSM|nr:Abhydrolase domain-containing protein 14B [Lepeophtheirus salmonis]
MKKRMIKLIYSRIHLVFNMKRLSLVLVTVLICFLVISIHAQNIEESGSTEETETIDWKNINYTQIPIPKDIIEGVKEGSCYRITDDYVDIKGTNVYFKEANPTGGAFLPSGQSIFLLHGAAFTSATWENSIPTLQTLACLGYNVIAIDLPGFGKTRRGPLRGKAFLEKAIKQFFKASKPVVVSPSMPGSFSLPLLVSKPELFGGFIPVAPVATGSFTSDYPRIDVPTMIVFGETDGGARRSNENLSKLPNSSNPQELKNARHPAYLDQPDVWHTMIHNFMLLLS